MQMIARSLYQKGNMEHYITWPNWAISSLSLKIRTPKRAPLCARCSGRAPAPGFPSLSQDGVVSITINVCVCGIYWILRKCFYMSYSQKEFWKYESPFSPQSPTRDGCSASIDHSWIRACSLICCCCFLFRLEHAHKPDPSFFAGVHPWCPSGIRALVSHSWAALFNQKTFLLLLILILCCNAWLTFTCVHDLTCLVKGCCSITVAFVFKRASLS